MRDNSSQQLSENASLYERGALPRILDEIVGTACDVKDAAAGIQTLLDAIVSTDELAPWARQSARSASVFADLIKRNVGVIDQFADDAFTALRASSVVAPPDDVAAPAVATAAGGGDDSDQLAWMVDTWREMRTRCETMIKETEALEFDLERPALAQARLTDLPDLVVSDYHNAHGDPFHSIEAIERYVSELIEREAGIHGSAWCARVKNNAAKLKELFQEREKARVDWDKSSGLSGLELGISSLQDAGMALERAIARHPVSRLSDIILKTDFLHELGEWGDPCGDLRGEMLASIRAFAAGRLAGTGGAS